MDVPHRMSVSPNPPLFDVDVRQASTTPPPAPGPYNPGGGAEGSYKGGTGFSSRVRQPPPPPPPPQQQQQDTSDDREKQKYEKLQEELKAKFLKVQREYSELESNLKADYASHEEKMSALLATQKQESTLLLEQKEREWLQKDDELRQLHKMMALQQKLMEEQLESVKARERDIDAKEADMKTRLDEQRYSPRRARLDQELAVLHEQSASLNALETRLLEKEKTFKDREITIVRLEKQNIGYKRMQRATQSTVATSTDCETIENSTQHTPLCYETGTATDEMDGWANDLRMVNQREQEAGDKVSHAQAMWASAKRREGMLQEWEEQLKSREDTVQKKEEECSHIQHTLEKASTMTEMLKKAAAAAESKLSDELDERLTRRLHSRERMVLMRSTQVNNDDAEALEAWESDLEGVRTMLHEKAIQIQQVLGVRTDTGSTSEEDLKAREAAMRDKETQWAAFLRREVEHRSLEAQRFDVAERVREVAKREKVLDQKQMKLNEDKVMVSTREVEARRIEDEAARVIQRLEAVHTMRTKAQEQQRLNELREQQIEKEYAKLKQRWDLIREKEKHFEQRLQIEKSVPASIASPSPLHTPAPFTPHKSVNLETAVRSITTMLDGYAATTSSVRS